MLGGDAKQCLNILNTIQESGGEAILCLWALSQFIRQCVSLVTCPTQPPPAGLFQSLLIWPKKRSLFQQAIKRHDSTTWLKLLNKCYKIDGFCKGVQSQDPWLALRELTLAICGQAFTLETL